MNCQELYELIRKQFPNVAFTSGDIARALGGEVNLRTLRANLRRLVALGLLKRRRKGRYYFFILSDVVRVVES